MDRSSKAITLALIGSAFVLGGCQKEEDEWGPDQPAVQNGTASGRGHGGLIIVPVPRIGGGGGAGGGVSSAPSARGGFGSTGVGSGVGVGS
jgi:hypothetical protein